jgi:hypothetical protein
VLVAGLVTALVVATGEDDPATRQAGGSASATGTAATQATSAPPTAADAPPSTQATGPVAADPATPAGAVRAFYERAADDDLDGAWELAGPELREQFGGSRGTFDGTFRTLESVRFSRLEETARTADRATVAVTTTARHTDRTDRCTGTLRTVRAGAGAWLVARAGVSCRTG